MKKLEYFQLISNLFKFKIICDEHNNEYVLFAQNSLCYVEKISDRTQFEACENHIHLIDNLKKEEYASCIEVAQSLGKALLYCLHATYPERQFVVFVSLRLNDSMIIRFHQRWQNEAPYFNPNDFASDQETVLKFEL